MTQEQTSQELHEQAWKQALEELLARFEQGDAVTQVQFDRLAEELEAKHQGFKEPENPLRKQLKALRERAQKLEDSAAEGTGPTDQVSSILAPLTGSDDKPS